MTSISLNEYVCCLISFNSEDSATTKVRAYKKHDPSQSFDIDFFHTTYIHAPVAFEEPSLVEVPAKEAAHVFLNLPEGLQKGVSLFRFGDEDSEKYIVSGSHSIEQTVSGENWTPPSVMANNFEWPKDKYTKGGLSEITFFYLNSMHLTDGLLYLSITATNSKDKAYHLYCQDVRYLQIPTMSACEPFQVAGKKDTANVVNKIGLGKHSNVSLLETLANNVPIRILCSNFTISPISNA